MATASLQQDVGDQETIFESETLNDIGGSLMTIVVEGLQQLGVQLPLNRRGAGLRGPERPERWKRGRAARLLQTWNRSF